MKRALEIAYTVCNKVCEWLGGWVYVCHSFYSIAHLVMSTKSVSFSMGYIFTWRIFPWRWTKMCIAHLHLHTFHMWIDRHRESLCSIYSIHSPKPITKTLSPPPPPLKCISCRTGIYLQITTMWRWVRCAEHTVCNSKCISIHIILCLRDCILGRVDHILSIHCNNMNNLHSFSSRPCSFKIELFKWYFTVNVDCFRMRRQTKGLGTWRKKNEPFSLSEHRRFALRCSHLTLKGAENVPNQGKSKCIVRTMKKKINQQPQLFRNISTV